LVDVVTTLFVVMGALGAAAAALHMAGWIPPRYRRTLAETQLGLADAIGARISDALDRGSAGLAAQVSSGVTEALVGAQERAEKAMAAEVERQKNSLDKSALRAVRSLGDARGELDDVLAEAILGPAMPILEQFAPGLAAKLRENPEYIAYVVENPLFKKYIQPQIERFLGSQSGPPKAGGSVDWSKLP
jgi:hypothetical protein